MLILNYTPHYFIRCFGVVSLRKNYVITFALLFILFNISSPFVIRSLAFNYNTSVNPELKEQDAFSIISYSAASVLILSDDL